jgi:hypothetical protein
MTAETLGAKRTREEKRVHEVQKTIGNRIHLGSSRIRDYQKWEEKRRA